MAVYKLSAKDGKGAWFARRSVHEGIGFSRWRTALEREFPKSMEVQGAPGEGNIRGIGGERRVERKVVDGVGKLEGTCEMSGYLSMAKGEHWRVELENGRMSRQSAELAS